MNVNQTASLLGRICAFALVSLLTTPANATKWECGERSNLPPEGKNYCAGGDFRQAESKLIKLFETLLVRYKDTYDDATAMNNAQIAFEAYRDNQCAAQTRRIEDKPFHSMVVAQCKTRLTNLRIDELERLQQQKW